MSLLVFFFNDTATTEIYTLSLHDALPIWDRVLQTVAKFSLEPEWEAKFEANSFGFRPGRSCQDALKAIKGSIEQKDRKSTRLNSSHANISYAVFCLKKKMMCSSSIAF